MKIIFNSKQENNVNKGLMNVVITQHVHRKGVHGSFPEVTRLAVREAQNLAEFLGQKGVSAGVKRRFLMCIGFWARLCVRLACAGRTNFCAKLWAGLPE